MDARDLAPPRLVMLFPCSRTGTCDSDISALAERIALKQGDWVAAHLRII